MKLLLVTKLLCVLFLLASISGCHRGKERSYSDHSSSTVSDESSEADYAVSESTEMDKSSRKESSNRQDQERANLLTATEVNDFKKWDEWELLLEGDFHSYKSVWKLLPKQRFVARVADALQRPIADAVVKLYDGRDNLIWSARTDNTGTAHLWSDFFLNTNNQRVSSKAPYKIVFSYGNEQATIENAQPYPQQTNVAKLNLQSKPSDNVDLFFIVDATGSMSDELHFLQAELYNIIGKVRRNKSNLNVRVGSLVYRDKGDDYVTRESSLDANLDLTLRFLKKQQADGGGDTPEAIDEALYQAIDRERWRGNALARIAFLVLDAPAHDDVQAVNRLHEQIKLAASKGIRIVPIVASGMEQYGEYLMRSLALATNGTYVALTDDSGIGNPHAQPTTDYYKVEKLNDLLVRLIDEYTRVPNTVH